VEKQKAGFVAVVVVCIAITIALQAKVFASRRVNLPSETRTAP
jgi:hypothetical protein